MDHLLSLLIGKMSRATLRKAPKTEPRFKKGLGAYRLITFQLCLDKFIRHYTRLHTVKLIHSARVAIARRLLTSVYVHPV